jgi:hypothetical protein
VTGCSSWDGPIRELLGHGASTAARGRKPLGWDELRPLLHQSQAAVPKLADRDRRRPRYTPGVDLEFIHPEREVRANRKSRVRVHEPPMRIPDPHPARSACLGGSGGERFEPVGSAARSPTSSRGVSGGWTMPRPARTPAGRRRRRETQNEFECGYHKPPWRRAAGGSSPGASAGPRP